MPDPITYETIPHTFEGLLVSAREQAARQAQYGPLPRHEMVTVTAEAMFDAFATIVELRTRIEALEDEGRARGLTDST
jgi:hypothetical protein